METVPPFPRLDLRRFRLPANLFPALVGVLVLLEIASAQSQTFFPLQDVRPGLKGTGRTVFSGNRIEDFQVEILGVLENLTPKQSIILARLSGGPLAETGVMQGMSGSPVYIGGKLLGAIALGFPFSKEPIAGIQPIEQMIDRNAVLSGSESAHESGHPAQTTARLGHSLPNTSRLPSSSFGNLREIFTPLSLSGFSDRTGSVFATQFRQLGLEPQQGVSSGQPASQAFTGTIAPGSMISVQLLTGDMAMSADGTVTYVDGRHFYAFGHRFLDTGSADLPFARAEVVALLPALNSSFKLSAAREWVGSVTSDRSTAIAGEIGRPAALIPLTVSIHTAGSGTRRYRMRVVNDPLLTPFLTQTAVFSCIDATERTLGAGTLQLHGRIEFQDPSVPALEVNDTFVSDSGVALPASNDAVATLNFVLGSRFQGLKIKDLEYEVSPIEPRRQLRIAQAWTSRREARPGESIDIAVLLQGENGVELTRSIAYRIPSGAPLGSLNVTLSDALTVNSSDFAGISAASFRAPGELVRAVNQYRDSNSAYVRIWRQEPAFNLNGPSPSFEIADPPPSVLLVLADPSSSSSGSTAASSIRGSTVAELRIPVDSYVVTGAKTIQIEIKD